MRHKPLPRVLGSYSTRASCGSTCPVTTCCAAVPAVAIFGTLSALGCQLGERPSSQSRVIAVRMRAVSVGPGGTGYHMGGFPRFRLSIGTSPTSGSKGVAKDWDKVVVPVFNVLTDLLPAPSSESPQAYDLAPHATLRSLLSLSMLPNILASLLRNDSVTDWNASSEVYYTMLRFCVVRRLSKCCLNGDGTWPVPQGLKLGCGVRSRNTPWNIALHYEYLNRLVKQGEIFLTTTERAVNAQPPEVQFYISASQVTLWRHGRNQRIMDVQGKTTEDQSSTVDKRYAKACDELAFKHVVLGLNKSGLSGYMKLPASRRSIFSSLLTSPEHKMPPETPRTTSALPRNWPHWLRACLPACGYTSTKYDVICAFF